MNAGCMENTTILPNSTMKDHFKLKAEDMQPVDKAVHLKKTDFSDYTEAKLKVMQHIKNH